MAAMTSSYEVQLLVIPGPELHESREQTRYRQERSKYTPRMRQAIYYLAHGLTTREIGVRMFITETTVKSHLARAFTRLRTAPNGRSSVVLIADAFRIGLLCWDGDKLRLKAEG